MVVSSVLLPFLQCLCLLRQSLLVLHLASQGPASLAVFVLRYRTILSYAKAGHKCREGCHGPRLFLAEVACEPFIMDAMLKGCYGFGIRTVKDLVLFG